MLHYHQLRPARPESALRPFDARRAGTSVGEGAGALVLETEASAAARGAKPIGEYLGAGDASEGTGMLECAPDGDGPARAIEAALRGRGHRTAATWA